MHGPENQNRVEWRRRTNKYWFWDDGHEVLTKEQALQSVIIGDTLDGDELVVHPNDPERVYVLSRESGDIHVALSKLEKRFLRLLRELGLPLPTTNIVVSRRRVDCRWFEYRLTVELDSYQFHNSRYSWEQDRKREREAYARGDQFRRYTWSDVFEDPSAMLRELRALLGQPAAARP